MDFWVDFAAIAGFVLALALAIQQIYTQHIRLRIENVVLIPSRSSPKQFFLFLTLSNKRSIPLSVTKARISSGVYNAAKSEIVYSQRYHKENFDTGLVVLSTRFPIRFEAFESQEICLSFDHQHIKETLLLPDMLSGQRVPGLRGYLSQKKARALHTLAVLLHKPSSPSAKLRLYTSHGVRTLDLRIDEVGDMEWLGQFAVRRSILDGTATFS